MDSAVANTPPRMWELSTSVLLAAVGAATAGSVLMAAYYVYVYVSFATTDRIPAPGLTVVLVPVVAYGLVLFVFVAVHAWWSWSTRRMLLDAGVEPGVLRHGAKKAFLVLLILSFCCGLSQAYANPDPTRYDRTQWRASLETSTVSMMIRVAALALLLYGTWAVRANIRRAVTAVARPSLSPIVETGPARVSRATPAWAEGRPAEAVAAIPPVADEFWARVRGIAVERGADLALLETTPESARRRWLLIPPAGPLPEMEPGSLVTVFLDPPRPPPSPGRNGSP